MHNLIHYNGISNETIKNTERNVIMQDISKIILDVRIRRQEVEKQGCIYIYTQVSIMMSI